MGQACCKAQAQDGKLNLWPCRMLKEAAKVIQHKPGLGLLDDALAVGEDAKLLIDHVFQERKDIVAGPVEDQA